MRTRKTTKTELLAELQACQALLKRIYAHKHLSPYLVSIFSEIGTELRTRERSIDRILEEDHEQ